MICSICNNVEVMWARSGSKAMRDALKNKFNIIADLKERKRDKKKNIKEVDRLYGFIFMRGPSPPNLQEMKKKQALI